MKGLWPRTRSRWHHRRPARLDLPRNLLFLSPPCGPPQTNPHDETTATIGS
jgi:hypothetical protein